MRTNSQELLVWRVGHNLTPFSWFVESSDSLGEIIVVKDVNISVVVAHGDVVVSLRVSETSSLLMDWIGTHGGGG